METTGWDLTKARIPFEWIEWIAGDLLAIVALIFALREAVAATLVQNRPKRFPEVEFR